MEEQRSGKIIAHVDHDLADLIPGYLANRKKILPPFTTPSKKMIWIRSESSVIA